MAELASFPIRAVPFLKEVDAKLGLVFRCSNERPVSQLVLPVGERALKLGKTYLISIQAEAIVSPGFANLNKRRSTSILNLVR